MPYFDLHCHPGLKTLFLPQDGTQLSAWQNVQAPTFLVGDILCSQSSLGQISSGQVPLICITLHPPEAGMLDQLVIKLAAGAFWSKLLNEDRLDTLISGADGYQYVFYEELANIMAPPRPADGIAAGINVKFLKNWADFDPSDKGTVHVVFNIEGGHALYPQGVMGDGLTQPQPALDNLATFINRNFLTLYLTPTHLTPNSFINHAYGNKILTKGPLLPRGFGITTNGLELIKYAYERGLLIDVKHMSLLSRLQFYRIHNQFFPGKPIIASHAGLTGAFAFGEQGDNFLEWSPDQQVHGDYVQVNGVNNRGLLSGTSFYPLSINLFDQDVEAIMQSGGLIGISMDVRILGGKDNDEALVSDYLSTAEYEILVQGEEACMAQVNTLADALWAGAVVKAPVLGAMPELPDFKLAILEELEDIFTKGASPSVGPHARAHARLIANQLLQLLLITRNAGPQLSAQPLGQALARDANGFALPWNNICIGSDFDGLIEAVDCCKNVTALGTMAELLTQELSTGAADLHWDLGMPVAQIVDQFCYTNAYKFLNRHFNQH